MESIIHYHWLLWSQDESRWKDPQEITGLTLAQSRASSEVRPGFSRLDTVVSWNPWGWRLHSLSEKLPHSLSLWRKSFSTHSIWTSLVSSPVVCHSRTMFLYRLKPWPCILDGLPIDAGLLLLGTSKAFSSPDWTSPISSARPQRAALQSPTSL